MHIITLMENVFDEGEQQKIKLFAKMVSLKSGCYSSLPDFN